MTTMNNRAAAAVAALALIATSAVSAGVVREDLVFLHADGRHYTAYKTVRSDIPKWRLTLGPGEQPEDFVYIHPDDYERQRQGARMVLTFSPGSYAMMRTGRFKTTELQRQSDGSFAYSSWNGEVLDNGHFGKWTVPGKFERFAYIWSFPDNIEILDYSANRDGDWTLADNTLAWSAHDVNDLTFDIRYRVQTPEARIQSRPADMADDEDEADRITLDSTNLFPSGSHQLTAEGETVVLDLADRLAAREPSRVIVEGHTDNQPLKPYLRKRYPSNWELSAARATVVVRRLAENGVDAAALEARAYGEQRPVASNDTAAGRAKNRRIEILVVGGEEAAPAPSGETDRNDGPDTEQAAVPDRQTSDTDDTDEGGDGPAVGGDGGFTR